MNIVDMKIMKLRKANRITQADLGESIHSSAAKVSNVENSKSRYDDDQVELALVRMDMAGAPLAKEACNATYGLLDVVRTDVRARRFGEAEATLIKLKCLEKLEPCDFELAMAYRLSKSHLFLFTERLDDAEEQLKYVHAHFDRLGPKNQYYFYCNMGALHVQHWRYKDGLACCINALMLSRSNKNLLSGNSEMPRLFGNIGMCYSNLHYPNKAIIYLQKARGLYPVKPVKEADMLGLDLDLPIVYNYLRVDAAHEAEDLLESCNEQANILKDDYYIGMTMLRSGEFHMNSQDWKPALKYLDKSIECYKEGTEFHFIATHRKILCLIKDRTFTEAENLIAKAQRIYGTHEVYSVYIESTVHHLTISRRKTRKNSKAIKYIQTVTIPFLIKMGDKFEAIEYYELLEEHFDKIGNPSKSLEMSRAIKELYKECYCGDERSLLE